MVLDPQHLPNVGKAMPMTVITALNPWLAPFVRPILCYIGRGALKEVAALEFIHFAHWSVVRRAHFERPAAELPTDRVTRPYFLFVTNFNGPWDQYIDAFTLVAKVRRGINFIWGTSASFPWAEPVRRFKRYIRYHQYTVGAYYNAYPDATVRDITDAVQLHENVRRFIETRPGHAMDHPPPPPVGGNPPPPPAAPNLPWPFSLFARIARGDRIFAGRIPPARRPDMAPTLLEHVRDFSCANARFLTSNRRDRTPARLDAAGPKELQL